jgi:hypothetical protein
VGDVVDLAPAREKRRAARLGLVLVIAALFVAVLLMRVPSSN